MKPFGGCEGGLPDNVPFGRFRFGQLIWRVKVVVKDA